MYILRAVDRAGTVGYYTGKAGPEWVSNKIGNAFVYENIEGAKRRAISHNHFEQLHGMWFVVVKQDYLADVA